MPLGQRNCLRHNAGDVGTIHPAAVDACCAIAPVGPKHQAKETENLVVRVKGACGLLRKTSDLWEHRTSLLAWASGPRLLHHWRIDQSAFSGLHQSWKPGRETVWGRLQERTPVTDVAVVVLTCGYLDFVSTSIHQYSNRLMGSNDSASTFCKSFLTITSCPELPFKHSLYNTKSNTYKINKCLINCNNNNSNNNNNYYYCCCYCCYYYYYIF